MGGIVGAAVGVIILVVGYTLGRTFVYANWQTALVKLPFEFLQGFVGLIIGPLLCYGCKLKKQFAAIAN